MVTSHQSTSPSGMRVSLVSCQWLLTSALTRMSSLRIARWWSIAVHMAFHPWLNGSWLLVKLSQWIGVVYLSPSMKRNQISESSLCSKYFWRQLLKKVAKLTESFTGSKSSVSRFAIIRDNAWFSSYHIFQAADTDRDGMVSVDEFDKMMDVATAAQIRLGLPAPFPTKEERIECFKVNCSSLLSLYDSCNFCRANFRISVVISQSGYSHHHHHCHHHHHHNHAGHGSEWRWFRLFWRVAELLAGRDHF